MEHSDEEIRSDPVLFALEGKRTMRGYQEGVLREIARAALNSTGESFVVMFPRQSGKNELQAQLEAYLLWACQYTGGEIVKVSPTWSPQAVNAIYRLRRALDANPLTSDQYQKERGYIIRIGEARMQFFSGQPGANIVGATASTLLEVDEAQTVGIEKYDKEIAPMASSTNATRVFWGTAWTSRTLLARELRASRAAELRDGHPRVFFLTANEVAREVPAYGAFVAEQVARLGRDSPMVRTQYYSEEIDGQTGMFPAARIERMRCGAGEKRPEGEHFAMLLDVAGEDETTLDDSRAAETSRRDATALTIVAVDLSTERDPLVHAPTFHAVERRLWVGVKHTRLYGEICELARQRRARWLVVDATGVGAGLASFLAQALPGKVVPFTFTGASKSKLGWDFLEVVDSGRWREAALGAAGAPQRQVELQELFFQQLSFCQSHVLPGPGRLMRWGVPDGMRDPASRAFLHDDLVISAALCTQLAGRDWGGGSSGTLRIAHARDPLEDMRGF